MRRRSRITQSQTRALGKLEQYSLSSDTPEAAFGRKAPLLIEIGFGNGAVLAQFAATHPSWNCIGVDVFKPGIGALINRCQELKITNVRIVDGEGLSYVASLPDQTADLIWVLFPDPWPKPRHHKRRLVTREFGEVVAQKLKLSGKLVLATDWQLYADAIGEAMSGIALLSGGVVSADTNRLTTKYEARGLDLGHRVTQFEYQRAVLES